jgi:IMP dehydrogenase
MAGRTGPESSGGTPEGIVWATDFLRGRVNEGSMAGTATVKQYMTREVATVSPEDTVAEVARRIAESNDHNGFPVANGRKVVGFVTARDLLLADGDALIFTVMTEDLIVAHPEMKITDAARVILRSGIRKLPVVDDAGNLVGIISNTDVVRSQIERATPEKVGKLMRTLEQIHGVTVHEERRTVRLQELIPTQGRVYADELEGRQYELERGLAEPLVVIDNGGTLVLADGHHRVLAADGIDMTEMDAYVIVVDDSIELGMQRTAEKEGLSSIDDVEVVDYARHPLIETTERLQ